MSASDERLLSLEDVADRLQVSDQSVRRWIKAGKLAAYKPGLEWRISPSDLEDFLQTHSSPKVQAPLPSANESPERRSAAVAIDRYLDRLDARLTDGTLDRDAIRDVLDIARGFGPFFAEA